jgi:hypothetical protein
MAKTVLFGFWMTGLAWVVRTVQIKMDADQSIRFVDDTPQFLPKGKTLAWMSLGYRSLVADWLWIRTVLYFGRRVIDEDNPYYAHALEKGRLHQELAQKQESIPSDSVFIPDEKLRSVLYRFESRGLMDDIYPLLDRVTDLDPHFIDPYLFGGVSVLLSTGEIEKAIKLLEKGRVSNPVRWEPLLYLGWVEWIYRGRLETSRRYLMEAITKTNCPPYVGRLLWGLSGNLNQNDLTKDYLEGLLKTTKDLELRKQLESVLNEVHEKPRT